MTFEFDHHPNYEKEFDKLDKSIQTLTWKKMKKILENPYLSKPMEHSVNERSERVKNYRIVFKIISKNKIRFYRIRKRPKVYSKIS